MQFFPYIHPLFSASARLVPVFPGSVITRGVQPKTEPRRTARRTTLHFIIRIRDCKLVRVLEIISFNSETCLAPGEQIIKYGLNSLPRNCRYCALHDFLKFFPCVCVCVCVCVWIIFVCCLSNFPTHIIVLWG